MEYLTTLYPMPIATFLLGMLFFTGLGFLLGSIYEMQRYAKTLIAVKQAADEMKRFAIGVIQENTKKMQKANKELDEVKMKVKFIELMKEVE